MKMSTQKNAFELDAEEILIQQRDMIKYDVISSTLKIKAVGVDVEDMVVNQPSDKQSEEENNMKSNGFQAKIVSAHKFAILPRSFPSTILSRQFVEELNTITRNAVSNISQGERLPGLIYMIYQAGYCKVLVQDLFTKNWIIDQVSNLTYEDMPLMIRSISRIPKCIFAAMIPDAVLNDRNIFPRIDRYNQSIKTRLWKIVAERREQNELFILVEVDAENAKIIESLSNVIYFDREPIQFELVYVANR